MDIRSKTYSILSGIILLISCGENREEEYRPRTDTNKWIVETMSDVYLWNETMKDNGNMNAMPEIFFTSVLTSNGNGGRSDSYSFIDIDGNKSRLEEKSESYGFEYFTETVEGKAIAARVLIVYKGSPAERAGLKRGDRITAVNGIKLTSDNISNIEKGGEASFQLSEYRAENGSSTEDETLAEYAWTVSDTIAVGPATMLDYNPSYLDTIYNIEGKSIGYIVLNKIKGSENINSYIQEVSEQIGKIKSCNEIIIDVRYNSISDIRFVTELASMLYGNGSSSDIFLTKRYNSNYSHKDSIIYFTDNSQGNRLDIQKLHFITSESTAMETEAMLRSLSEYMEISTIGNSTQGKNIIMQPYQNPDYTQYVIYPVVAYYSPNSEETNSFSPVSANIKANERDKNIEVYKQIGDTAELLLSTAIKSILYPEPEEPAE